MPFPTDTFLQFFRNSSNYVAQEFENLYAQLEGYLRHEHKDDGSHGHVTADSVTAAATVAGVTATFSGEGPHTFNEIALTSSEGQENIDLGPEAEGWIVSRRAQTGVDTSGYGLKIYDRANPAFAVVQLAYYTTGGYYWLQPHDQKGLALGYKDGTSSDRIKYLAVQDGMYEKGRTAAAGYWTVYTPTWASSGTQPTNGTYNVARYTRVGEMVFVQITMSMTGSTTFGTGTYSWSLPVNATTETLCMGTAFMFDNGTSFRTGAVVYASATSINVGVDAGTTGIGATVPFTWANGDYITMSFSYKAA
jgi:hypothetical protein